MKVCRQLKSLLSLGLALLLFAVPTFGDVSLSIRGGADFDTHSHAPTLLVSGNLTITLDGYAPVNGDSFDFFDATTFTGTFENISLPSLSTGLSWDLSSLYVDGSLAVSNTFAEFGTGSTAVAPYLWLDASDAGALSLDSTGNVQKWFDKSGNNRHAFQDTAVNRPELSTLNGRQALEFDGSNYYLNLPNASFPGNASDYSIFIVINADSITATQSVFNAGPLENNRAAVAFIGNSTFSHSHGSTSISMVDNLVQDTTYTVSVQFENSGTYQIGVSSLTSQTLADQTRDAIVHNQIAIGGSADGNVLLDGQIAEILIFDTHEVHKASVEQYLGLKYGSTFTAEVDLTGAAAFSGGISVEGTIGANLDVIVTKTGYEPVSGNTYKIITANTIEDINNITLPTLNTGLYWDLSALYSNGQISPNISLYLR